MRFGIPSAAGGAGFERRIPLTPRTVAALVAEGHEVIVERGAGEGAGFSDERFEAAGAQLAYSRVESLARAEVVVGLHRLSEADLRAIEPGTTALAFHQFDLAPPALRRAYAEKEVVAVGLDRLRDKDGGWPVVSCLAELAGAIAPQIAARMLESTGPGRPGVLLGRLPGVPPAEVVIIGAGTLGTSAARAFAGAGCSVQLLDRSRANLGRVAPSLPPNVVTDLASPTTVQRALGFANVLVGAVRDGAGPVPTVLSAQDVAAMRQGAAILDFAIAEGGCVATSRPIASPDDIYDVGGVLHFTMPNATTLVARAASRLLGVALLPFLQLLGTGVTPKAHRVFAPAIHFFGADP